MTTRSIARHPYGLFALTVLWMLAAGCDQSARSLSLDEPQAREACATFLKAWQDGKMPADLKPGIIGSDYDWAAGKELVSFEILPEETSDGTNLHIPAELMLKDPAGGESKTKAIYTVGTSPVVTVVRK